ncbi:MAG: hypothetical protein AB8B87_01050 [Granulosicoccus sp.]
MLLRFLALSVFCVALQIGGCTIFNDEGITSEPSSSASSPLDLIAQDFVSALSQLESLPPAGTTVDLQRSDRSDGFTLAMLRALQKAGYGVRWVENEGSASLFQYRQVAQAAAAAAQRDTYELAVGFVEMRRDYVTDGGVRVRPVTPLYVRGTDASGIVLNDAIFDQQEQEHGQPEDQDTPVQNNTQDLQVAQVNAVPLKPLAKIQSTASPALGLQNPSSLTLPSDANPLSPIVGSAVSGGSLSLPLVKMPRGENVFELGGSNFADALAGRSVLAEQVLIFGNDSMRLGGHNKTLVKRMVERFDPQTDVFSVIGCSMGPTAVKGGNAALALGRAGRVVEALRFAGVDDSQILDEGCWAGDGSLDDLPRRGVVLTLNRQG